MTLLELKNKVIVLDKKIGRALDEMVSLRQSMTEILTELEDTINARPSTTARADAFGATNEDAAERRADIVSLEARRANSGGATE